MDYPIGGNEIPVYGLGRIRYCATLRAYKSGAFDPASLQGSGLVGNTISQII